jgi:hypothetical protein
LTLTTGLRSGGLSRKELRELRMAAVAEADEEDAFAVLRHDALRVYHAVMKRRLLVN